MRTTRGSRSRRCGAAAVQAEAQTASEQSSPSHRGALSHRITVLEPSGASSPRESVFLTRPRREFASRWRTQNPWRSSCRVRPPASGRGGHSERGTPRLRQRDAVSQPPPSTVPPRHFERFARGRTTESKKPAAPTERRFCGRANPLLPTSSGWRHAPGRERCSCC